MRFNQKKSSVPRTTIDEYNLKSTAMGCSLLGVNANRGALKKLLNARSERINHPTANENNPKGFDSLRNRANRIPMLKLIPLTNPDRQKSRFRA